MVYVETVCPRDCYDTCSMKVLLSNNKNPTRVVGDEDSLVTRGFLCPRGVADIRRAYSRERVLYPHRRVGDKPDGPFERVSWNDALNVLADKIRDTMNRHGPDSLLHLYYSGNMGLFTTSLPQRLFYALGFSQTDEAVCSRSGHEALSLHYGSSYGSDPDDLPKMKLTVYWGFNAAVSAPHLHSLSSKTRTKGGLVVAVDPRQCETTRTADLWIQPKPGSDVALALGVMKHMVGRNLVDIDFLEKYTQGFGKLKEEVSRWSLESIEKVTGLNWDAIAKLAELYADNKPSVTMIGIGMQKGLFGAESVRAVSLIPALVGLHRGFYYSNSRGWNIDNKYLTGESLTLRKIKVISQVKAGQHLKQGEYKFLYIHNMNPAETLPNVQEVVDGLRRRDLYVVVHDTHWTQTAKKYADLVLPAPTFLEKEDIVPSYSHRYVRKSNKVMEPLGESRDELWLTSQVAGRLNLSESWLREDKWEAIEKAMKNAFENGSPADLREGKKLKLKMKPKSEYQTPSGKIEFYATKAEELGITPLPKQYPLPEGDGFVLLTSAVSKYTHTQFQDVYGPLPPIVLINPEDARTYSLVNEGAIELIKGKESIELRAEISNSVPKGVLWSPRECRDLNGKPQNTIIPDTIQNLGGGSTFNTTVVKVRKK
ncbi:MAG: molybdopterin-dependent oxidoreductase [Promethearchaeati archaeon SRVP18_Atabeyarchaeia-1]